MDGEFSQSDIDMAESVVRSHMSKRFFLPIRKFGGVILLTRLG